MELLGIVVDDLDAAVERYASLFGLTFHVFSAGVDYALTGQENASGDPGAPLPSGVRIAMDESGCFELIEIAGAPQGMRNIHFRVDDMCAAIRHFQSHDLTVVQDLQAGLVREVIFNPSELNQVRLCLVEYEGPSFAEALLGSPRP